MGPQHPSQTDCFQFMKRNSVLCQRQIPWWAYCLLFNTTRWTKGNTRIFYNIVT